MINDPFMQLSPSWQQVIGTEFNKPYMQQLRRFLLKEQSQKKSIYPPGRLWFNALNSTPFEKVKVVILGQDPYHGAHQAHGLCFSVPHGVPAPPSLKNIFKELQQDLALPMPAHGCLQYWVEQGVLLLNAVLTVEAGSAASHQNQGWEAFTDAIISALNNQKENIVFLLWGAYAQQKGALIDEDKHCVLKSSHPSPLSAYRGFLGCQHFSKTNAYLTNHNHQAIDWSLTAL